MKYGGKREDGQKKARRCKFCVQHIIKSVENVKKKPLDSLFKSKKVKIHKAKTYVIKTITENEMTPIHSCEATAETDIEKNYPYELLSYFVLKANMEDVVIAIQTMKRMFMKVVRYEMKLTYVIKLTKKM